MNLAFFIIAPIALPLLAAPVSCFVEKRSREFIGALSALLFIIVSIFFSYAWAHSLFPLGLRMEWFTHLPISFSVEMTPVRLLFVWLNLALFCFSALIAPRPFDRVQTPLFLLMLACLNGVFLSEDLFLFYLFWEISLLPLVFLMLREGKQRTTKAALLFFYFTFGASLLMLFSVLGISWMHDFSALSFSLNWLSDQQFPFHVVHFFGNYVSLESLLFWGFFVGVAVKIPLLPLHVWLPPAHVESPTHLSVLFAGIFLKMGIFALVWFILPIFPRSLVEFEFPLRLLALLGVFYASLSAYAQKDAKSLVAYSSIAHMGLSVLGVLTWSVSGIIGGVLLALAHGLSSPLLFFFVSKFEKLKGHRDLVRANAGEGSSERSGRQSFWGTGFLLALFASLGLPGFANFVGEFSILFDLINLHAFWCLAAVLALILGAGYHLKFFRDWGLGRWQHDSDPPSLGLGEKGFVIGMFGVLLAVGLSPSPLVDLLKPYAEFLELRLELGGIDL